MNESFVFKNKKGATCGYIMARGRQLRIRLPEGMEKACLTAVYEDGERNFEGGFDGYETERPNDGRAADWGIRDGGWENGARYGNGGAKGV